MQIKEGERQRTDGRQHRAHEVKLLVLQTLISQVLHDTTLFKFSEKLGEGHPFPWTIPRGGRSIGASPTTKSWNTLPHPQ